MRESEKAWLRYQATCREGDRLRMAAVVSMGVAMLLPLAFMLVMMLL